MIDHIHAFALPAAYAVLPARLQSPHATALLLAIGLQESGFVHRRQVGGPARGFWQFERAGVHGVLTHERTRPLLQTALRVLQFDHVGLDTASGSRYVEPLHALLEHNDVVAAVCARLLLVTVPQRLPQRGEAQLAWEQYLAVWRPGKPHLETWDAHFAHAWTRVARAAQETTV